MINFLNLYYFAVTAEEKNITKAAKKLFISQQSLSNHIKKLENTLGVKLFNRYPTLTLTYAGERLLNTAHDILNTKEQFIKEINDINNNSYGRISIGISYTRGRVVLPLLLPLFKKRYPHYVIDLHEGSSSDLINELLKGTVDVIITFMPPDSELIISHPLMEEHLFLAVPREYMIETFPKNYQEKIVGFRKQPDIDVFCNYPFILMKKGHHVRKNIDAYFASHKITPNILLETDNLGTSLALAAHGIGIAIQPEMFVYHYWKDLAGLVPPIETFPLNDALTIGMLVVCYHKKRYQTEAVKFFIKLAGQMKEMMIRK